MGLFSRWGGNQKAYKDFSPPLNIDEYFNGPVKAWGMIQNMFGTVDNRFHGEMAGEWDGDTGTLNERFEYSNGDVQTRVWTLRKGKDGFFEGEAADIDGKAAGCIHGNSALWRYVMMLPVGKGKTVKVKFTDWLFLMEDGVIINRIKLKKFGIKIAELTIMMQK